MNRHADGFLDSRGTVLVASASTLFTNIVGGMLAECGFEVAHPAESEAAWLSVTRTQPSLVICDSGLPATNIKRLIAEVCERHLPLLLAWPREDHAEHAPDIVLPNRVAWLTFPIDRDAFRATIEGLLPSVIGPAQQLTMSAAGENLAAKDVEASDHTSRRSIRLLP